LADEARSMTETTNNTASLRSLIPRIFSRAQPVGAVDRLIKTVRLHHPKADIALIERAYAAAELAHRGQKRRSGEPYITHPVAVAQILADLGIGSKTIAAACCTTRSKTPTTSSTPCVTSSATRSPCSSME
jgi:guanosine-3',5'-bis(diphosphate) 3'-pyrophosphohydrolase